MVSKLMASNGTIKFDETNLVFEMDCENYKYIRVYNTTAGGTNPSYRLYLNNSSDYIRFGHDAGEIEIKDFQINHFKIEFELLSNGFKTGELQYYLFK